MSENDNIYLNVTFNHDSAYGNRASPAIYNVTKNTPILSKCNDYYCSVIRFDIPLDMVPLFVMPTTKNPNDINQSSLIIGMTDANNQNPVSFNITYYPENNLPVPSANQSDASPYFYVYSYNHLLDMINYALADAFANAFEGQQAFNSPFFVYNGATQLISLMLPDAYIQSQSVIFMNNELATFLDAFNLYSHGDNQPLGRDFDIDFRNQINNTMHVSYNNVTYYQMTQEYNVVPLWSQLRKLMIVSNSIPINAEYIQINGQSNDGQNLSQKILTDFVLSFNQAGDSRSIAVYNPTSQYRLVDMVSSGDLMNIGMQIYWIDKLGNTQPLLLSVFQQASVKLGFFKKSLYKRNNIN